MLIMPSLIPPIEHLHRMYPHNLLLDSTEEVTDIQYGTGKFVGTLRVHGVSCLQVLEDAVGDTVAGVDYRQSLRQRIRETPCGRGFLVQLQENVMLAVNVKQFLFCQIFHGGQSYIIVPALQFFHGILDHIQMTIGGNMYVFNMQIRVMLSIHAILKDLVLHIIIQPELLKVATGIIQRVVVKIT